MNIRLSTAIVFASVLLNANSQVVSKKTYTSPFDFPLSLSSNFGELRNNHFHGGLDIKTQGTVGKKVHCIADGYVSRVLVSAGGYGQAVYITHNNGYTSVYGHVKSFAPVIQKVVDDYQLKHETFSVDLKFQPGFIKFKAGDVIALSGNEGMSFGPHLHIEIRNSNTNEYINPLSFYKNLITDTRPPVAKLVALYPIKGEGEVEGSQQKKIIPVAALDKKIEAWGKIGVGISAFDYMNNTSNHYGVSSIKLTVDGNDVFSAQINGFLPEESRMVNAYADFEELKKKGRWIMRSYLLPGNNARFIKTGNNLGIVDINQQKDYSFRYELQDLYGNKKVYNFTVRGRKRNIMPYVPEDKVLKWNRNNIVQEAGMELNIPKGMLYDDVELNMSIRNDTGYVANVYQISDVPIPLHTYCQLMIGLKREPVRDSGKYYVASLVGHKKYYVGGELKNGWIKCNIRELGTYTVDIDTIPPRIVPLSKNVWKTGNIQFKIHDAQTGIKNYKVTIDNRFYVFSYSLKNGKLMMKYPSRLNRGVGHNMEVVIEDNCGNITREKYTF